MRRARQQEAHRKPSQRHFWYEDGDSRSEEKYQGLTEDTDGSLSDCRRYLGRSRNMNNHGGGQPGPVVTLQTVDDLQDAAARMPDMSSEMRRLPYVVEAASFSCPDAPANNLTEAGRTSTWKGGSGDGWVLLRLQEKSLLSFLRVRNRSTTEISISISVAGKKTRDFVPVKSRVRLAHGYLTDVKIGHLPCLYIQLACRREGPGGVSLHELVPVGIPTAGLGRCMGPSMESLTYKSTEKLLFGPSLRTSRPAGCTTSALRRLVLPPSHLRRPSYDDDEPQPEGTSGAPRQAAMPAGKEDRQGEASRGTSRRGRNVGVPPSHHQGYGYSSYYPDGSAEGRSISNDAGEEDLRSGEERSAWFGQQYSNNSLYLPRRSYDMSSSAVRRGRGGDRGVRSGGDAHRRPMRRTSSNEYYPRSREMREGRSAPAVFVGEEDNPRDPRSPAYSRQRQVGRRRRYRTENQENEGDGFGEIVPERGNVGGARSFARTVGGFGNAGGGIRRRGWDGEELSPLPRDPDESIFSSRAENLLRRKGGRMGRGLR